jgi:hypothetical protein
MALRIVRLSLRVTAQPLWAGAESGLAMETGSSKRHATGGIRIDDLVKAEDGHLGGMEARDSGNSSATKSRHLIRAAIRTRRRWSGCQLNKLLWDRMAVSIGTHERPIHVHHAKTSSEIRWPVWRHHRYLR